jgi:hypothetical protein
VVSQGERAGRFRGENRSECGMHHAHTHETTEGLNKRAERIRAGYVWEQVTESGEGKGGWGGGRGRGAGGGREVVEGYLSESPKP